MFSGKIFYNFAFVALCGVLQTHFSPEGLRPGATFTHFTVLALSVFASQIQLSQRESQEHCRKGGTTKKHRTFLCSAFLSGGDYRDRTGDLLHAMQALSRTTHSRTPTQRCEDGRYLALERFISRKTHSHPKATLLLKRVSLTMYSLHPVSRCCQDVLSPFRHQTG